MGECKSQNNSSVQLNKKKDRKYVITGFVWHPRTREGLGCYISLLAIHLAAAVVNESDLEEIFVPRFPGPELRIPRSELPEFFTANRDLNIVGMMHEVVEANARCHGIAVNSFLCLDELYCEEFKRIGPVKRGYYVGPLCLPQPPAVANIGESCISWLDSKMSRSVVYICFGTFAPVSEKQLDELALGLEASGKPFLWAVRADGWVPPAGWKERVGNKGLLVTGWVSQTAILAHRATAAFLTHCGSSSLLEAVAAGVPLLTWPLVFGQFIEERLVTDVLRIGERVWDGPRSVRYEERKVVPAAAVARAVARMASPERSKKLRVLLIPFFAASHIGPFTDLAFQLAMARPDVVEPTIAVTPANVPAVRSALKRHGSMARSVVSIATYPFPEVAGLPSGIENLSTAGADGWRIDAAAVNEAVTRPVQEMLIREQSPDSLITDVHFSDWNASIAEELGVPCVAFSSCGCFSALAMHLIVTNIGNYDSDSDEVVVAGFPGPELGIPWSELPDFLSCKRNLNGTLPNKEVEVKERCHDVAVNTFMGLEQPYCEEFIRGDFVNRTYCIGPLCLPQPPTEANLIKPSCISWLDSKPSQSVLFVCFGSFALISDEQLDQLALGLEASGEPFLWAVRADGWSPPAGWEDRVGRTGLLVRDWVPQTTILCHRATAVFLTHCGWNSVLEATVAGVPLLTWPLVFEQFIEERLVTDVLRIGERVWDGPRSVRYEEKMVVPAAAIARAVTRFLKPGGTGDGARLRVQELAAMARVAVAEGGSSYNDLRRLIVDLTEARSAAGEAAKQPHKKLRVLLMPFFATSHIGPYTDLAFHLAAARPDAIEPIIAVTPANVTVVQSALNRHGSTASSMVSIATYPFPDVAGLPPGVENLSTAGAEGWRIDNAAVDEALTRPAQEALIRDQFPDVLITDVHFTVWNAYVAECLGMPCFRFSVVGLFSLLAIRLLTAAAASDPDSELVNSPVFPGSKICIPRSELPDFMTSRRNPDEFDLRKADQARKKVHGVIVNIFLGLEQPYHEKFIVDGFAERVYCVGPLCLPQLSFEANVSEPSCISWLDSKPNRSVVYICFGSFAPVSEEQLDQLALGLEASGKPFLWSVRADGWAPPAGWEDRVGERGLLVRGWVPQTAILAHRATVAFLTHCGSSSLLEAMVAGVPLLTWPLVFDQFIEERLVTDVLRIGERVWDGPRSVRYEEKMVVPAAAVARAVARFLEPGGTGDEARVRAQELAVKAHAAVAEDGSSYNDLRRLIDDMVEARAAATRSKAAKQPQIGLTVDLTKSVIAGTEQNACI
uniref:Uncharacterized protein n=1 Tax=Leersia perrieri TaxID=77586 RepID=A0A0D9WI98_9ORYZ